MSILFLNNSELKGSTFRSRLLNFEGRDISEDVFSLIVKNNLGTEIKSIFPTIQGNVVLFQLTELESLSSATYNLEYWGNFAGLGKEMIAYENLVITKTPNSLQKNKNISIAATVEIEDVIINIAISNPIVSTTISNSYSTQEILTGGTWIDGKPIYRKVFISTINNGAIGTNPNIQNVDNVINISGIYSDYEDFQQIPLPFYISPTKHGHIFYSKEDLIIIVGIVLDGSNIGVTGSIKAIVEYTKTTSE